MKHLTVLAILILIPAAGQAQWSDSDLQAAFAQAASTVQPQAQGEILRSAQNDISRTSGIKHPARQVARIGLIAAGFAPLPGAPFLAIAARSLVFSALDAGLTAHCISVNACHELNPLLPHSAAGAFAVSMGEAAGVSLISYELKKHQLRRWWIPEASLAAAHAAGLATAISAAR